METQNQRERAFPLKNILQNDFWIQILKKSRNSIFLVQVINKWDNK